MRRNSDIWTHFDVINGEDKHANCRYCSKRISYKGTIHNLKSHLKFKHKSLCAKFYPDMVKEQVTKALQSSDDDDDSKGSDTLEEFMLTDPIFKYFSKEKNRTARCDLCHQTVPLRVVRLKAHMKEMHPEIKPNEDSDTEEQKNSYQEIVYFYESDSGKNESKSNKVAEKLKVREKEVLTQPERKKRRFSVIRESVQDAEDEEIANFTKYITCLMKPLPKEVCTQLQMDIINLIMTAKLKCTMKETFNTGTQIENSQPPIIFTVESGLVKSDLSMAKTQHIVLENNSMNDSQNSNIDS